MKMALLAKGEFNFVDGSLSRPEAEMHNSYLLCDHRISECELRTKYEKDS